jgi:hypothetical protein
MQDRYAGDVGDFGKLALLRALGPHRRLGICWYRTEGSGERTNDGRHLDYLDRAARFRSLDAELFDRLSQYVADFRAGRAKRSIAALQGLGVLPAGTIFHGETCPAEPARGDWAARMVEAVTGADLVFLDPDNGLEGQTCGPKSASVAELVALRAPGRALLLYHHQTRLGGGAEAEVRLIRSRLRRRGFDPVVALRLRPYSSRFYFLLDANDELRRRLARFADAWGPEVERFGI